MKLLEKLKLVFSYGDELQVVLEDIRKNETEAQEATRKHHLRLCLRHQQEQNHSHFAMHNCDHCTLEAENKKLHRELMQTRIHLTSNRIKQFTGQFVKPPQQDN